MKPFTLERLPDVHPRDLFVPGRGWLTFMLKIWGHEIKANTAAVPDTYAAINRIPGVHSALFSILAGGAEIEPHRGSAAGVIRFHYPLIVPKEPEKCWIEIGGHHFFWQEGEPLVFLHDHPTTGGYPVVGVVDPDDLWQCAQLRPGDEVRFTRR